MRQDVTPAEPRIDIRSLSLATDDPHRFAAILDDAETARAGRFRFEADRDRFILGRGLLRTMLGEATGRDPASLRFGREAHGKPTIADADELAFNVSHSGDVVMVAVGRAGSIGIDVEQHRGDIDPPTLGRHVFTPAELATIAAAAPCGRTALFFRQWVFKEALVKGLGTGLARDPARFQITFERPTPELSFVGDDPSDIGPGWQLRPLVVDGDYSAALAILPSV